jgi:hypothetical protein
VSQHVIISGISRNKETETWEDIKWVFGWDQPLMSFYLQKHDAFIDNPDDNPVLWLGATSDTKMYEVEDLVREAAKAGLAIDHETQVKLYTERKMMVSDGWQLQPCRQG